MDWRNKMAVWTVATTQKKSCEEREIWYNEEKGWTITRINGYRWGTFIVETTDDEPPEDIDADNPDGINMYDYFSDNAENGAELDSMDDGWLCDWEWDIGMTEEDQQIVSDGWDEDSYEYMESNGWYNSETEAWLYGPLEIKKGD
jgi:hypothetical protein